MSDLINFLGGLMHKLWTARKKDAVVRSGHQNKRNSLLTYVGSWAENHGHKNDPR